MNKENKRRSCISCEGTGIDWVERDPDYPFLNDWPLYFTCSRCNGSGYTTPGYQRIPDLPYTEEEQTAIKNYWLVKGPHGLFLHPNVLRGYRSFEAWKEGKNQDMTRLFKRYSK